MEKSLKSISINYGIYLGLALTLITVLVYAIAIDLFTQWWLGILLILLIIGFGVASALKSRKMLGGFMSFKEAFTSYFITVAIGTLISTIVGIVIFNFVDPESAEYINEKIITMTAETMENWGAPQSNIDETIAKMEGQNNFSTAAQTQSYFIRLVIMSILGLIVAVAVKRKDPNAA
jgi:c-di-AMP phosphodiesterase-like protein